MRTLEEVKEGLSEGDGEQQFLALEVAEGLGQEVLPIVASYLLTDRAIEGDELLRTMALERLGKGGWAGLGPYIKRALADPSPMVRSEALYWIGERRLREYLGAVREIRDRALVGGGVDGERLEAHFVAAEFGDALDQGVIRGALLAADYRLRCAAANLVVTHLDLVRSRHLVGALCAEFLEAFKSESTVAARSSIVEAAREMGCEWSQGSNMVHT